MKILLDECVDAPLAREIVGHHVRTVPEAGWAGLDDRTLLEHAEKALDAFVTTDSNIEYQQNLANFEVAVIVLRALGNRLADLKPFIPELLSVLNSAPKRKATYLRA